MRVASEINILQSYYGDPTFDLAAHRDGFGGKVLSPHTILGTILDTRALSIAPEPTSLFL
jgi:hypothetical protein